MAPETNPERLFCREASSQVERLFSIIFGSENFTLGSRNLSKAPLSKVIDSRCLKALETILVADDCALTQRKDQLG